MSQHEATQCVVRCATRNSTVANATRARLRMGPAHRKGGVYVAVYVPHRTTLPASLQSYGEGGPARSSGTPGRNSAPGRMVVTLEEARSSPMKTTSKVTVALLGSVLGILPGSFALAQDEGPPEAPAQGPETGPDTGAAPGETPGAAPEAPPPVDSAGQAPADSTASGQW